MIKIAIKTILGEVAFEHTSEANTIKETVEKMLSENIGKWIKDIDLSNLDLTGVAFDNSTFDNATFDNSTFDNSTFYNSTFDKSTFDNSTFYNSTFDNSRFDNSRFYNSTFYNSRFDNSKFDKSKFYNSRFYKSTFYKSTFYKSKFYNSTFYKSKFYNSTFDNPTFDKESIAGLESSGALEPVRFDFFGRMLLLKNEVPFLKQQLIEGRVKGTSYEGTCRCFIGTAAKKLDCSYSTIPGITPDSSSDTERWFLGIIEGDTPDNSEIVKLTVKWIEEFERLIAAK